MPTSGMNPEVTERYEGRDPLGIASRDAHRVQSRLHAVTDCSSLAAPTLSAEDSVGFPEQPLDLVPEPGERLGCTFERERLDRVGEEP